MLKNIKSIIKSNAALYRIAIALHKYKVTLHRILHPTIEDQLRKLVRITAKYIDMPIFVKVGANDGITGDPFGDSLLKNSKWTGILIEPVPYCTDKLKKVYSDRQRFIIDQSAIGNISSIKKFYFVSESAKNSLPNLPDWYDQLGSFDRQHIINHLDGILEPFIIEIDVNINTLHNIIKKHQLSHVTLLHIDTEGYDLEVLKSLNFSDLCPSWIMIEHRHLSEIDREEMITLLSSNDYDICDLGGDFFAMYRKADTRLQRSGRVGRILRHALLSRGQKL
jgi:FkbM family methyltransferase